MKAVVVVLLSLAAAVASVNTTTVYKDVMNDYDMPWDMAFAPDGTLLYTEKCRGLSAQLESGRVYLFGIGDALLPANDLACQGQSGVHGVAIDPDFGTNRFVYVFSASDLTGTRSNHIIRLTMGASWDVAPVHREDIVTDIAYKVNTNQISGPGAHSGGRIRFGLGDNRDALFITTGDNHDGPLPQSPTRMGGKVLRVNRDGSADARNSPPSGFDSRVFAYGFRNVQGIDFRASDGAVFIAEHGPAYDDEVTIITNGGNGGWDPHNRPALNCPSDYCGYAGTRDTMPMTDEIRFPGVMPPLWTYDGQSHGLAPCTFLTGPQWGKHNGWLALGVLGARRIELLHIAPNGELIEEERADVIPERYRSLVQGPDGALYAATDSGFIRRFTSFE